MPSSTVHAVLVRCRLNRLAYLDRATGEPIRRNGHSRPGDLLHMDVKKLGKVPDRGGWRCVGRQQGVRNRAASSARTGAPKGKYRQTLIGTCYLHTVIDDHARVAYVEAREDETKQTAADVLRHAVACERLAALPQSLTRDTTAHPRQVRARAAPSYVPTSSQGGGGGTFGPAAASTSHVA